ncbi:hypothetical protein L6259_02925 [Candidatus Parcubacteria bacterium]|nr:hypothetical protein [Patescibacteria group bacterium]MCG2694197.1 hypothetical protein [Candidatus Parcubacteria bacterium]
MAKRKIGNIKYEVDYLDAGKCVVTCPLETKAGEGLSVADFNAILKKEFRSIPRKNIIFSVDSRYLYFGNDDLSDSPDA